LALQLQLPPAGGGEQVPVGGPGSVPISEEYILLSYLPFIVALVVIPLIGLLVVWARGLVSALRGRPLTRPESTVYSLYIIVGIAPLLGGAFLLHKFVLDYVYGYSYVNPWRWIWSLGDWERFLYVASLLSKSHFLAGLALGLLVLIPWFRRSYEYWWVDTVVYGGNLGLYLYLSVQPLQEFKYTSGYAQTYGVNVTTRPYSVVEPILLKSLILGLILGLALSLTVIVLYERARRRGG